MANYINESDSLEVGRVKINGAKDKTILWLGTSIPAGSDTALESIGLGKPYPELVGEHLGANIINNALGSSMCRASTRQGDYTGGVTANITRALSQTLEEKDNLITDWEVIRHRLKDPDTFTTISTGEQTVIRGSSFEQKLLPYLDGTYEMPDLLVIDHGHNDYKYTKSDNMSDIGLEPTFANILSGELAEDTYMTANNNANLQKVFGDLSNVKNLSDFVSSVNRNCFIGGMNFIVTLILKYNPHAKIIFVSNYNAWLYKELIPVQEFISKDWHFPLCEIWRQLGYSNHYIPGTKYYWGTSGTGYTGYDLRMYDLYLKDGTHPHSDTSGDAIKRYAENMAVFINNVL